MVEYTPDFKHPPELPFNWLLSKTAVKNLPIQSLATLIFLFRFACLDGVDILSLDNRQIINLFVRTYPSTDSSLQRSAIRNSLRAALPVFSHYLPLFSKIYANILKRHKNRSERAKIASAAGVLAKRQKKLAKGFLDPNAKLTENVRADKVFSQTSKKQSIWAGKRDMGGGFGGEIIGGGMREGRVGAGDARDRPDENYSKAGVGMGSVFLGGLVDRR